MRAFPLGSPAGAAAGLCLSLAAPATAQQPEPDFATVERHFRDLPLAAREHTGPLFWLHGDESQKHLEDYVAKVHEGGNGSLTAESRPHRDWLGPDWYRDLGICIEACRQRGLKLWIFDEKWWPSQGVGGKVPERYAAKRLVATSVDVDGGRRHEVLGHGGPRHVASIAGRLADDGESILPDLVDLAPFVRDGALAWTVPAGRWRIMTFTHETAPGLGQGGGQQLSVDGMSRDCVQWLLDTVYQPHFDRFGEHFGKTVVGFFYDEPETRGDWGTELPVVLAERGVDWKLAYVAYKFRLAGEAQAAARFQYLDARAETWGRTMYGMTTRWCEAHGVASIGHFMEHGNLYLHQDFCAGDLMQLQKYSSMGGIDAVFDQFVWGRRDSSDSPCWQTPKLGSSVSHAYGKRDDRAMVEIFGARGQDLTYPEMKWWTDAMHVAGINFLVPHSFNPRAPADTDCPPYFYNGGHEPRWPLYRVFADYTSRLSVMLTGGRHVAPVALVPPGQSLHVGKAIAVDQLSEGLQDALYDCDWIPYEVLEGDMQVEGSSLVLRQERYRVLCLPAAEVMPVPVLEKARRFFEAGGVVVVCGFLPRLSATPGRTAADVAALREAIWGDPKPSLAVCRQNAAGGRSYLLPENPTPEQWQQVLAGDAGVRATLEVVEGRTDHWLHVLHRVKCGRDVFFVTNQDHRGERRRFRLRLHAPGFPECWDAMRNEITAVPCTRAGEVVDVELSLEPNESVLLVCQPTARSLPLRIESGRGVRHEAPAVRRTSPPQPVPSLPAVNLVAQTLAGQPWVWYPEGKPQQQAPAGTRYFRRQLTLPAAAPVRRATFVLTADNHATVHVNGKEAGHTDGGADGWRNPVSLDVTLFLRGGENLLAIAATNAAAGGANPAGLLGVLTVEYAQGRPMTLPIDANWKAARDAVPGWTEPGFDDSAWVDAVEIARYGDRPWGGVGGGMLTLSPAKADPFDGDVELQLPPELAQARVYLEGEDLAPEAAARVHVNGQDAGGFLGRPFRLDVTRWIQTGTNQLRIEPFAPKNVRLVVYE